MLNQEHSRRDQDEFGKRPEQQSYSDFSALSFHYRTSETPPSSEPEQNRTSPSSFETREESSVIVTEHVFDIDGHQIKVFERRPNLEEAQENPPPMVYLPGYLEGLQSNEEFLQEFDDRVVYAIQVSAGADRFQAFQAVSEEFLEEGVRPDVVTHSMGAFVLDHDFDKNPEDMDLFGRVVLITPPGFIENDSVPKIIGRYISEVWQSTFSSHAEFRRSSKAVSLLEAFQYIGSSVWGAIREGVQAPGVDLSTIVRSFRESGKKVFSVLTTSDKLLPGDKTRRGLERGGLSDEDIDILEGTHIPHLNSPYETASVVKSRLEREASEEEEG